VGIGTDLAIVLIGGLLAWLTYVVLAVRFVLQDPEPPKIRAPSSRPRNRVVSRHHVGTQAAAESLVLHATQGPNEAGTSSGEPSATEPVKENEDGTQEA
jgi:hypothetical protein